MQIHELPSGTPVDSDLIPFDTGSVNYKTPFSGFDVGENTATFTSADEADPAQFKTVDPIETGPIKTILNRLSMAVSNIRYIWKTIGTHDISAIADGTITGAIKNVGDIKTANISLNYQPGDSILTIVQRAYANAAMPKGVPFYALVQHGAYYVMQGYWYSGWNYGFCNVSLYWSSYQVFYINGEWSIRGTTRVEDMASGYLTTAKSLATSYDIIPIGADLTLRGNFERSSAGGYKALKAGAYKIAAFAYMTSLNADDTAIFVVSRYNGGWVSDSPGVLAVGKTERSMSFPTMVMTVAENDIIYLRGRNVTAARGSVTSARILIEPVY